MLCNTVCAAWNLNCSCCDLSEDVFLGDSQKFHNSFQPNGFQVDENRFQTGTNRFRSGSPEEMERTMGLTNGLNPLTPEIIRHEIQRRASAIVTDKNKDSETPHLIASRQVFEEVLERLAAQVKQERKIA